MLNEREGAAGGCKENCCPGSRRVETSRVSLSEFEFSCIRVVDAVTRICCPFGREGISQAAGAFSVCNDVIALVRSTDASEEEHGVREKREGRPASSLFQGLHAGGRE